MSEQESTNTHSSGYQQQKQQQEGHHHHRGEKKSRFDHAIHHPVPEMLKHTTSPLSAALFLFGVGTVAKAPSIRCWWTARRTLGLWNTVGWRNSSEYGIHTVTTTTTAHVVPRSPAAIEYGYSIPHQHAHSHSHAQPLTLHAVGVESESASALNGAATATIMGTASPHISVRGGRTYSTSSSLLLPSKRRLWAATKSASPFPSSSYSSSSSANCVRNSTAQLYSQRGVAIPSPFHTSSYQPTSIAVRGCYSHEERKKTVGTRSISSTTSVATAAASALSPSPSAATTTATALSGGLDSEAGMIPAGLYEKLGEMYSSDIIGDVAGHLIEWPTVQVMTSLLEGMQSSMGLPWWAAIMTMTFALRATVLPLNISFMRHQLRVKILQPTLRALHERMTTTEDKEEKEALAKESLSLLKESQARPLVQWWIPLAFPPYFLSWFGTVYNSSLSNPQLLDGGLLWFNDLTATDPTFLLPVVASLTWLGIVEMNASAHYLTSPRLKMWTRFTALALVPVLSTLPAAVFCFWIPSNLWEIARIHIFNKDSVRKALGIPLRSELPPVKPATW